jgi:hypothetical protein
MNKFVIYSFIGAVGIIIWIILALFLFRKNLYGHKDSIRFLVIGFILYCVEVLFLALGWYLFPTIPGDVYAFTFYTISVTIILSLYFQHLFQDMDSWFQAPRKKRKRRR